ncbi:unnamed protein product [Spirodela intermedia]|uniref:DDRGK domain-containing protein 1 n=1 Tax=Spirodela intermedia TaxID=51605 RepID=A0ABN7EC52_SPIIN|nr:unnamed protein product [Spirodela intermedia]
MLLVFGLIRCCGGSDASSQVCDGEEEDGGASEEQVVQHAAATRRMRRRPAVGVHQVRQAHLFQLSRCKTAVESDEEDPDGNYNVAQASKQRREERNKSERHSDRYNIAEEAARESENIKQDYYNEMRRRKDEEREAQERLMEEEALAKKIKEEKPLHLILRRHHRNDIQNGGLDLLSDFVEYIKKQKCIPLEDLAAEFKLRTQECINRITSLESMGTRLSGVMDDRGKYIYISPEEMKAVSDYIKSMGRVSISHLASKSNQFIDLDTKPQLVQERSQLRMAFPLSEFAALSTSLFMFYPTQ